MSKANRRHGKGAAWATNAVKYGALSSKQGKIDFTWQVEGTQLTLNWREQSNQSGDHGTPGFETRLINASVRQLGGKLEDDAGPSHFSRILTFSHA